MDTALEQTEPKNGQTADNNGSKDLLNLLSPALVEAIHVDEWRKLDPDLVRFLVNTVSGYEWLDGLTLLVIAKTDAGHKSVSSCIGLLNSFLRWAIPAHYPDLAALNPEDALIAYHDKPSNNSADSAARAYKAAILVTIRYLETVSAVAKRMLLPFTLPPINLTSKKLSNLGKTQRKNAEKQRKKQVHPVVKQINTLMPMATQRVNTLLDLDETVQASVALVETGQAQLPLVVEVEWLDTGSILKLRLWDRSSWTNSHAGCYKTAEALRNSRRNAKQEGQSFYFLQLVGSLPDSPWFLRAVQLGIMRGSRHHSLNSLKYLDDWKLSRYGIFTNAGVGVGRSTVRRAQFIEHAQKFARAINESDIIFEIGPLLVASAIGLFALRCSLSLAMRIGELQQLTNDNDCIHSHIFPTLDAGTKPERINRIMYWNLFPKGRDQREKYIVNEPIMQELFFLNSLHKRFFGKGFQAISPASSGFTHLHQFDRIGKYKFVLQWAGKHLNIQALQTCLDLILLEHVCRDEHHKPVRITFHVLRHAVPTYLRNRGIPLDQILKLLKHTNIVMTDYYSSASLEDLFKQIAPAIQLLTELAEIDPSTIRTPADIYNLEMESLKRHGVLRKTPGGHCGTFAPCPVQFSCATCRSYLPDPARRDEVKEKQKSCEQAIELFKRQGDTMEADDQAAILRAWKQIEREMDEFAVARLPSPPIANILDELGIDTTSVDLFQTISIPLRLAPGNTDQVVSF